MPSALAYLVVWIISALLHGALLLLFGNPIPAAVFVLIFLGLGSAGAGVIVLKNRRRLRGAPHQNSGRVPNQAVQRTGASRFAQGETRTSSAAGSRR